MSRYDEVCDWFNEKIDELDSENKMLKRERICEFEDDA